MPFLAYARTCRMGLTMKQIRAGELVIDAQLNSGNGFRDAFSKLFGAAPLYHQPLNILKASSIDTCLGPMIAIADEDALYLLDFVDHHGLERKVARLKTRLHAAITPGTSAPIQSIEAELQSYFNGSLKAFKTTSNLLGSDFQKQAWHALRQIPYGETRSYREQAYAIGKPTAYRAVANANGANQLAIMIPCHRIITSDGNLGGYSGGIARKRWLIEHEKKHP